MSTTAVFLTCLIVGIPDGDTVTAKCPDATMKIRLAEIDAPEKKQPFGTKSKQSLSDLCFQTNAKIQPLSRDRYQRTIAKVSCGSVDAGTFQISHGMAWVYDRYVGDRRLYDVQETAKNRHLGVWSEGNPVPPWEWRKAKRNANSSKQSGKFLSGKEAY